MYVIACMYGLSYTFKEKQLHKRGNYPHTKRQVCRIPHPPEAKSWPRDDNGGKVQLNNRQHFKTISRIKTKEAALLGREIPFNLGGGPVYQEAGSTSRFQFCLELETWSKASLLCSNNSVSSSVNWRLGSTQESNETAMECLADIMYPTRYHLYPGSLPPSNSSRPGGYYTSSHKGIWLSLGLGQQDNE